MHNSNCAQVPLSSPPFRVLRVVELVAASTIEQASDYWGEVSGDAALRGCDCRYWIVDSQDRRVSPAVSDEEVAEIAAEPLLGVAAQAQAPDYLPLLIEARRRRQAQLDAEARHRESEDALAREHARQHWQGLRTAVASVVPEQLRPYTDLPNEAPPEWSENERSACINISLPHCGMVRGFFYSGQCGSWELVSNHYSPIEGAPGRTWGIVEFERDREEGEPLFVETNDSTWWAADDLLVALAEAEARGDPREHPERLNVNIPF